MLASLVLFCFVTCFHSVFHVSSHFTLHRSQMYHVNKKDTTTLTETHKTENRSSTNVQTLCSSNESPCSCHCTGKLYRQQRQQQQDASGTVSARNWKQSAEILLMEEMKKNPGNSTEESETSHSRKLLRNITHVEEKPKCKIRSQN